MTVGSRVTLRRMPGVAMRVNAVAGDRAMVAFGWWGRLDWCWFPVRELTAVQWHLQGLRRGGVVVVVRALETAPRGVRHRRRTTGADGTRGTVPAALRDWPVPRE